MLETEEMFIKEGRAHIGASLRIINFQTRDAPHQGLYELPISVTELIFMVNFRKIWRLLKETVSEWQFNQVSLLASSLAYYTVFSLAPLAIVAIMIVGAIFGEAAAKGEIVARIQDVVGQEGAQVIETAIANLREDTAGGAFRLIITLGVLLFGASGVFAQIQNALDKIWEVKPEPGRNIMHFLRKRLLSFAMVLVIAFLLLVSMVVNTVLGVLVNVLSDFLPGFSFLWQFISFLVSFGMITLLFAAIYTILPDAQVEWRDAFVGAIITAILFMLGQFLFGLFLSRTQLGSAYGVAGSFIIIITWIYYAAHILFLGAEFTKVYARRHGSPIVPEDHAVSVSSHDQGQSQKSQQKQDFNKERIYQNRSSQSSYIRQISYRKSKKTGTWIAYLGWHFKRMFPQINRKKYRQW